MPRRRTRRAAPDTIAAADAWFLANGLTYFVPEVRRTVRTALRPRRTLPLSIGVALLGAGVGAGLAWLTGQFSAAPAVLVSIGLVAAAGYALGVLRARPIVTWALAHTFGGFRALLPMMTRALPLLLIFVTFLFINAEVWQLASELGPGTLWLVVLLFVALAVGFLLVRLPEEVDKVDDYVDARFLRRTCRGTPLEEACEDVLSARAASRHPDGPDGADGDAPDPVALATVQGMERWNLVLVLLVIQAVQVLLLAAVVLVFFLVFGSLTMGVTVQAAWTGFETSQIRNLPVLTSISVPLFQVSLFLAAFSFLYLTVATLTDDTYRDQFFANVMVSLERAVGMRAVYRALRGRRDPAGTDRDDADADADDADRAHGG